MKTQDIKTLLDRYFEGATTLQEEQQLRRYFNQEEVEPSLLHYQPLFQYFEQAGEVQLSEDFESRLFDQIDAPKQATARLRPMWRSALRIAAAVAVLVAVYFLLPLQPKPAQPQAYDWEKVATEDPDLAYEQTEAALRLLASKLNGGAKTAVKEIEKVEKVANVFKK